MVLTDLPFHRTPSVHSRYMNVQRPSSALNDHDIEEAERNKLTMEYATFLRDQERKVSKDGYVDSHRLVHAYQAKQKKQPSPPVGKPQRSAGAKPYLTVLEVTQKKEKDKKEFDRRMKTIEDHMWQHKQQERELKRAEGDIIKSQREVRKTMRNFENAIVKKKMTEEKRLNQGLEKYTRIQQEYAHANETKTKSRIAELMVTEQESKDYDRKTMLKTNELISEYQARMADLEQKRLETLRITEDFESKLRTKEDEQYELKKKLTDLSIAINMEASKARKQKAEDLRKSRIETRKRIDGDLDSRRTLESRLNYGEKDTKAAEMNRRKLDADLALTKAHLSIKQRDEGRHLLDTRNNLHDNIGVQKSLTRSAYYSRLDQTTKEIDQKLQNVEARKAQLMDERQRSRRTAAEESEAAYQAKFTKRFIDQQQKQHEDHLKHFQKTVQKGEENEHQLYQKVREAEYTRQKQDQEVRRLHQKLADSRRKHQKSVTKHLKEVDQIEREITHKLQRQQSQLAKVHAEREESYRTLLHQRVGLREYQHHLGEHEREQERLRKLAARSHSAIPVSSS